MTPRDVVVRLGLTQSAMNSRDVHVPFPKQRVCFPTSLSLPLPKLTDK